MCPNWCSSVTANDHRESTRIGVRFGFRRERNPEKLYLRRLSFPPIQNNILTRQLWNSFNFYLSDDPRARNPTRNEIFVLASSCSMIGKNETNLSRCFPCNVTPQVSQFAVLISHLRKYKNFSANCNLFRSISGCIIWQPTVGFRLVLKLIRF